jgi:hypothetical protein
LSLLARLAAAAAEKPGWPWLFHRDGIDWRWRSFHHVADHVARASAAVADQRAPVLAYSARASADGLSVALAILAAGRRARPWWPEDATPGGVPYALVDAPKYAEPRPADAPLVLLPTIHSNLDEVAAEPLRPASGGALDFGEALLTLDELTAEGDRLTALAERGGAFAGKPGRCIVHAGARLGPALDHAVLALSLERRAALALEPYPEALIESLRWCRPHLAVLRAEEAAALAAAWTKADVRHGRLRCLLVAGLVSEDERQAWERVLARPVLSIAIGPTAP